MRGTDGAVVETVDVPWEAVCSDVAELESLAFTACRKLLVASVRLLLTTSASRVARTSLIDRLVIPSFRDEIRVHDRPVEEINDAVSEVPSTDSLWIVVNDGGGGGHAGPGRPSVANV